MAAAAGAKALKGIFKEMLEPFLKEIVSKDAKRMVKNAVKESAEEAFEQGAKRGGKEAGEKAARQATKKAIKDFDDVFKHGDDLAKKVAKMSDDELAEQIAKNDARKASKMAADEYAALRRRTPSQQIRDMVNEDANLFGRDPVLPDLKLDGNRLEADHILSMKNITEMDGFQQLSKDEQLYLLNHPDNFMGLSKAANASKGALDWEDFTSHKSTGAPVDPKLQKTMIRESNELRVRFQGMIDYMSKKL